MTYKAKVNIQDSAGYKLSIGDEFEIVEMNIREYSQVYLVVRFYQKTEERAVWPIEVLDLCEEVKD